MLSTPTISAAYKQYIARKLKEIEQQHAVRIVLALESGSRACGCPSKDSDYDVRFIYVRHPGKYLSIQQPKDVIETDIAYDTHLNVPLDLSGWDIRKALYLALKSNPALLEWLCSPIRYVEDSQVADLTAFARNVANLEQIKVHYAKLLQNIWQQIDPDQKSAQVKLYCYALRPALALKWITTFETLPPMDIATLYKGLKNRLSFSSDLAQLIALKANTHEQDVITRNSKLDDFIISMAQLHYEDPKKSTIKESALKEGNKIFRRALLTDGRVENPFWI